MVIVRIPRVAHQWARDVWEHVVECAVWARQNSVVVDMVVQHQHERACIPHGKDCMRNRMQPVEVDVEVYCAGEEQREVQEDVGDEDDVGILAHEGFCESEVGLCKNAVQRGIELRGIPRSEDPAFVAVRIKEGPQC